jgi:hypothetical protein
MTVVEAQARSVPIPHSIADVDAGWLTQALGATHPGLVVEQAQVVESLGGASTKLRMAVRTNRPDFPSHIIVKGCLEPHNQIVMLGPQVSEVQAYTLLVPTLDVETVRCFYAEGDRTRGAAIIMEDLSLRGVRCLRIQETISFELAAAFLDQIARLHARWWQAPELADDGEFGWIVSPKQAGLELYLNILKDPLKTAEVLSRPRGAANPRLLHDADRLRRAYEILISNPQGTAIVINHADLHLANLYVDAQGKPGMLDWILRRDSWAQDVTYFIVGALDPVDRRRWEGALLQHYLSRLAVYGVAAPSFEEAWLAYRSWPIWGLLVWQFNSPDFHTEAVITAAAARFGAAVVDHNTFRLLGV